MTILTIRQAEVTHYTRSVLERIARSHDAQLCTSRGHMWITDHDETADARQQWHRRFRWAVAIEAHNLTRLIGDQALVEALSRRPRKVPEHEGARA